MSHHKGFGQTFLLPFVFFLLICTFLGGVWSIFYIHDEKERIAAQNEAVFNDAFEHVLQLIKKSQFQYKYAPADIDIEFYFEKDKGLHIEGQQAPFLSLAIPTIPYQLKLWALHTDSYMCRQRVRSPELSNTHVTFFANPAGFVKMFKNYYDQEYFLNLNSEMGLDYSSTMILKADTIVKSVEAALRDHERRCATWPAEFEEPDPQRIEN